MDTDNQEPPRPLLRGHTTLRTLLVSTAVAALCAGAWRLAPDNTVQLLITSCAASFVGALLGLGLTAGSTVGFLAAVAGYTYHIAVVARPSASLPFGSALNYAIHDVLISLWIVGPLWLTATWWGLYLRYAWSAPKWPPLIDCKEGVQWDNVGRTLRERLIARCADAPLGCLIISILANVLLLIVGPEIIRRI
jgi:hypothetical protein